MSADHSLIASPGAERLLAALVSDEPRDWRDLALCAEVSGDEFYPEKGQSTTPAKRVCRQCEVREDCLSWALEHNERHGVWGGMSYPERLRAATKRSAADQDAA
jgi:WhiB family redox-sensing transcriptional regulator